ncbi:MAG: PRC-barrel domain-containing protein [Patescibacteria group bacterium]|nr:PRC-barrel domain-containing protein [Patescibacteria group bacterium]
MKAEVKMALNLRPISGFANMPVLDLESGAVLGRVLDWIFDVPKQKLVAFVLNRGSVLAPAQVLVPTDIVEYGPKMILARNRNALIHPKEVVGLLELMKLHPNLLGLTATSVEGKLLGKINDCDIDTISSIVQRYHIGAPLVALTQPDLLLPASRFVRTDKGRIIFDVSTQPTKTLAESQQTQTETA